MRIEHNEGGTMERSGRWWACFFGKHDYRLPDEWKGSGLSYRVPCTRCGRRRLFIGYKETAT